MPLVQAGLLVVTLLLSLSLSARAQPVVYPPGLQPGDSYRLVFVTSSTTLATSGAIGTYDALAASAVGGELQLQNLGATWRAIASTSGLDARDHTETDPGNPAHVDVPIYSVDGTLVASGNAELWSGALANAIDVDESGTATTSFVWTGTQPDGTQEPTLFLGAANARIGQASFSNSSWVQISILHNGHNFPVYALSSPLTMPSIVTETGLPGESYRLAFVTSTTTTATSPLISTYDAVASAAASSVNQLDALGLTWKAIASTSSVDARDHTETNPANGSHPDVPIYSLEGNLVALGNAWLWDGLLLTNSIGTDERGISRQNSRVWTGTQTDGSAAGSSFLGSSNPRQGIAGTAAPSWIHSGTLPQTDSLLVYALSSVMASQNPNPPPPLGLAVHALREDGGTDTLDRFASFEDWIAGNPQTQISSINTNQRGIHLEAESIYAIGSLGAITRFDSVASWQSGVGSVVADSGVSGLFDGLSIEESGVLHLPIVFSRVAYTFDSLEDFPSLLPSGIPLVYAPLEGISVLPDGRVFALDPTGRKIVVFASMSGLEVADAIGVYENPDTSKTYKGLHVGPPIPQVPVMGAPAAVVLALVLATLAIATALRRTIA